MTTFSAQAANDFVRSAVEHRLNVRLRAYAELTKPRITAMLLVCTAVGYTIAVHGSWSMVAFLHTILGTGFLASGAGALNQWMERTTDAAMRRTRGRPLPSDRVTPVEALTFGLALSALGLVELFVQANAVAAAAGLATLAIYLFVYTPLKPRSPICMLAGAVAGAMPPVIGTLSANPHAVRTAAALFAILFVWQMPHAYAIALLYRDDYERGGLRMLPGTGGIGSSAGLHIVGWSVVLVPVSLGPAALGDTALSYVACALVLGCMFVYRCTRLAVEPTVARARQVLLVSVVYLPLLLLALVGSSL